MTATEKPRAPSGTQIHGAGALQRSKSSFDAPHARLQRLLQLQHRYDAPAAFQRSPRRHPSGSNWLVPRTCARIRAGRRRPAASVVSSAGRHTSEAARHVQTRRRIAHCRHDRLQTATSPHDQGRTRAAVDSKKKSPFARTRATRRTAPSSVAVSIGFLGEERHVLGDWHARRVRTGTVETRSDMTPRVGASSRPTGHSSSSPMKTPARLAPHSKLTLEWCFGSCCTGTRSGLSE